ncbi:hypothetical protein GCM10022284_34200 [Streptomyces hundungensis]
MRAAAPASGPGRLAPRASSLAGRNRGPGQRDERPLLDTDEKDERELPARPADESPGVRRRGQETHRPGQVFLRRGQVKGAGPGRPAYFSLVNLGSLAWL